MHTYSVEFRACTQSGGPVVVGRIRSSLGRQTTVDSVDERATTTRTLFPRIVGVGRDADGSISALLLSLLLLSDTPVGIGTGG